MIGDHFDVRPQYDALIVGSGAGGAATAYRLVRGGLRVALLEKGGHLPGDGRTLDIQRVVHESEFVSREMWRDGRGRTFVPEERFNVGGKTKWYGAALLRFAEHEFMPDLEHGCDGWPITAADLGPYYDEAEALLGVRTFDVEPDLARILDRLPSWRAQAMPLGLSAQITRHAEEAAHFDGFASVLGMKGEAESSMLTALMGRRNFTFITHAEVERLIGSPGAPQAMAGVRLRDGRELLATRVFLAAGALHSPRLLQRYLRTSGLESLLPAAAHVGRRMKLHLLTAMVSLSGTRKTDLLRKTMFFTHDAFPHSSVQPLGFDGELISTLLPKLAPERVRRWIGERAYGFFLQTEDGAHDENRVNDAGDAEYPQLDYDTARLPQAEREHRGFTRALQLSLLRAGLVSFTQRVGLGGTAHACGSLRCGRDANDSVVDAQGRVHGMQGLYVVDGSILPRSSRVNPSLTIYAWGLRIGDLVAREFGKSRAWPVNTSTESRETLDARQN